ncbi:hypothetical protein BVC80_1719g25 [Macleaya cordata]|uniref:Uncharacterized protein n=1 Tax=Macleaya cordata TaxID=56857 RepID=A0A200Q2L1_MACCD|nr:hypothetical protein BVC80_1719g25 [Macleaya cordata]
MLCTGRSGPNWLDRLRSSKGFPVGNGIDLEHFLNANPNPKNDTILEKDDRKSNDESVAMEEKKVGVEKKTVTYSKRQNNCEKEDLFDIMNSVLSELFNMGEGDSGKFQEIRDFDKKKSCRKQKNPKLCVFSASASVDDDVPAMSPSSADNSVTEEKKLGFGLERKETVEDEKLKGENSGYSDVMIIDTSAQIWKSEKLVFRKGNVWKVWEKKPKCRKVFGCRKKRKSNQLSDSESVGKKKMKKQKVSGFPSSSDAAGRGKPIMLSNGGITENDVMEAWKKTLRFGFPDHPGNQLTKVLLLFIFTVFLQVGRTEINSQVPVLNVCTEERLFLWTLPISKFLTWPKGAEESK